jgi:cation transport regulator ChaC
MEIVAGRRFPSCPARLSGYRRRVLRGAVYPGLVPAAGERTEGVLWQELDRAALARIDRFEGELYVRPLLRVELESGAECEAFVYVLRPEQHALASDAPWSEVDFRAVHLRAYLAACRAFASEEP